MDSIFDIAVIGGGPGGYVAAIRAAQLGASVCLIEKEDLGGTCLNWGCIPTKALHRSAEVYHLMQNASEFGIRAEGLSLDWDLVQSRKRDIVHRLVEGVNQLVEKNKITLIAGTAKFISSDELSIEHRDGSVDNIKAKNIIIATGSMPAKLPIEGSNLPGVMSSSKLLGIDKLPNSITVIGGGVIGMEFASILNAFGSKVSVVEYAPKILSVLDKELPTRLAPILKKRGIDIYTGAKAQKISKSQAGLSLDIETAKGSISIESEIILIATGRRPVLDIDLEKASVEYSPKGILVDSNMRTNVPNIYAIGDVTGGIMLAHTASHEGICAVEHIMLGKASGDMGTVPSCIFTFPEIATVGITEEQAKEQGIAYRSGKFMFGANGKALSLGEGEGIIKVIIDADERLLGVHILGPHASDLIHEGALAISNKLTADSIIHTIHAHPTLGEAFHESVMSAKDMALHVVPKR